MKSLTTLLFPLPAWAGQGGVPIDSTAMPLGEAVVSATRWQQNAIDLPMRIALITSGDASFRQPQTTADLLGSSGQVYIQKSQLAGGSPMIRGFATHRLLYVVDGVRMNTAIFRAGNVQNVISLDPFTLQTTEVHMGPASVVYGSDAIGGVMSFQTLEPTFSTEKTAFGGQITARHATANNERTVHADLHLSGKRWAWVGSWSRSLFDDLKQGSHGPAEYLKPWLVKSQPDGTDLVIPNPDPRVQSPSAYRQTNIMQKVRVLLSKRWDLQYAFHHSATSDYGRYDRHTRLRKGKPRYAEWNYGPQIWQMHQLTATHSATAWYDRLTLRVARQRFEESRIDRALNSPLRTTQTEKVTAYSFNADFTKLVGNHRLYYGAEWVLNDVGSTGSVENISAKTEAPAASRYPQSSWTSLAVYAQSLWQLNARMHLEAGVRYNHFFLHADFTNPGFMPAFDPKVRHDRGAVSGGIGWVFRTTESQRLTLRYSHAFRAPNIDDMGKLFDAVDKSVVVPNPNLKPERAHHWEVGLEQRFGRWLTFDVCAFYTYLNDALVRRPFTWRGQSAILYKGEMSQVLALQNAAYARVGGVQTRVGAVLPAGFGLTAFLNWQQGREQLDDGTSSPMRHAAPLFGKMALTYRYKNLQAEVYSDFQARRNHTDMPEEEKGKVEIYALDAQGHTYAPGWITLNLRAAYRYGRHWQLNAGLENIGNLRYRSYSSGISAAGRNFFVALTYRI